MGLLAWLLGAARPHRPPLPSPATPAGRFIRRWAGLRWKRQGLAPEARPAGPAGLGWVVVSDAVRRSAWRGVLGWNVPEVEALPSLPPWLRLPPGLAWKLGARRPGFYSSVCCLVRRSESASAGRFFALRTAPGFGWYVRVWLRLAQADATTHCPSHPISSHAQVSPLPCSDGLTFFVCAET